MNIELKKTVECDDKIAPIILKLWEKGYITKACCQGHRAGEKYEWAVNCYIAFYGTYHFYKDYAGWTTPPGFYLQVFDDGCWGIYAEGEEEDWGTDKPIKALEEWVQTLKEVPEGF